MLTDHEIELIHAEADGQNSPEASAELRALLARDPEARALAADVRNVGALFDRVEERAPSPRSRQVILDMLAEKHASRSAPVVSGRMTQRARNRSAVLQWRRLMTPMERTMNVKRAWILGSAAAAIIAVIGARMAGYPPTGLAVGTIGGDSDSIAGVQQAARYRGRTMSEKDVSIANPEVQKLFQNHEVLRLVRSDAFRETMRNDAARQALTSEAFRDAMRSEAFRNAMKSESFREAWKSDAFREATKSEAFREALSKDAFREAMKSDAWRGAMAKDAFREAMANQNFREAMASQSFREAMASDVFRNAMASDVFRNAMASDVFRNAMASDAFRNALASDAFRQLSASEVFRSVARSQAASEVFLNEAMRAPL